MRAAFRCEGDSRRRRDQDEAGVLITGIVQRIGAAIDERVVERADRDQPLAFNRMRKAQRRKQDEEIVLGDPQLEMLARRRKLPGEGGGDALLAELRRPSARRPCRGDGSRCGSSRWRATAPSTPEQQGRAGGDRSCRFVPVSRRRKLASDSWLSKLVDFNNSLWPISAASAGKLQRALFRLSVALG
jgi:hypothetical protein